MTSDSGPPLPICPQSTLTHYTGILRCKECCNLPDQPYVGMVAGGGSSHTLFRQLSPSACRFNHVFARIVDPHGCMVSSCLLRYDQFYDFHCGWPGQQMGPAWGMGRGSLSWGLFDDTDGKTRMAYPCSVTTLFSMDVPGIRTNMPMCLWSCIDLCTAFAD